MEEFSVLIGGKAGEGINQAGSLIAHILDQLGYRIYIYLDYPSLIRGGHNFAIIRASKKKITAHIDKIDFLLALNQDCIDLHKNRIKSSTSIIYDSGTVNPVRSNPAKRDVTPTKSTSNGVKTGGLGLPFTEIVKEEKASPIMRNSCIIGAFGKSAGIQWDILEEAFRKDISREIGQNLKLARRAYNEAKELVKIETLKQKSLPLLTGNEAIGLGLVKGGLKAYIAYPMTPSSGLLHFLAQKAEEFSLKVVHPESEISVILMALGFSYAGEKAAVGTSGGGFCLMTEGLSLSGIAELPIVIMVSQRTGPSTGIPTYTGQSDLNFVLNAGHGEFLRLVVAPGDAEEAYFWAAVALNISWKYQLPSIIMSDKTLSEGTYSFDIDSMPEIKEEFPVLWDKKGTYKRYSFAENGVSPMAFVPEKGAVIKVNSYEHDEYGITTEDPQKAILMQEKRLDKEPLLIKELEKYETVKIYGDENSSAAILCWGSNKGVCEEAAAKLGVKVIQPVLLSPFPIKRFSKSLNGVKKIICVENNATGQLENLIRQHGFQANEKILKYDGRPFSLDELEERLKKVL